MTVACAGCGAAVTLTDLRMYTRPDGSAAIALCSSCRVGYDSSRQYSPSQYPSSSRVSLEGRGRPPEKVGQAREGSA